MTHDLCDPPADTPAPGAWMICPVCEGDGTVVNPNIDSNGLTREDFDEDPDFAEDYKNGVYDVRCAPCSGSGKIREGDVERLQQAAADRRLAAREDGNWEAFCGAQDWRYGY